MPEQSPPPAVMEPTPVPSASGWWASVGSFLGFLVDVLPILNPVVPEGWRRMFPVIGAVAGLALNRFFRPSWRVVRRRQPPSF